MKWLRKALTSISQKCCACYLVKCRQELPKTKADVEK